MIIDLHIIPILVSSIICFALGALWFSPALFGNIWMTLLGRKSNDAAHYANLRTFGAIALFILIFNIGMEVIVDWINAVRMSEGVTVGVMVGLAVSFTHTGIQMALEQKPKLLLAIYSCYYLCISVISASLMAMWR